MIHIRQCKYCKQNFILKNIAYEKRGGGKYCSINCSKHASKKHSFDEHYFDVIDTSTKAYWLGFLMADGCNTGDELTIELAVKDKDHLLKLKMILGASQKITSRKRGKHEMISLRLASRTFCTTLSKLGCSRRKTFTVRFPQISNLLARDFIRGYFDGDGCIYIRKDGKNKIWSIFSASENIINGIRKRIFNDTKIRLLKYKEKSGYSIRAMKTDYIQKLSHYFYDNRTPEAFMMRKNKLLLR